MKVPGNTHLLVRDGGGEIILSTLPDACRECPASCNSFELTSSCGETGKRRRARVETEDGSVFLCTSEDDCIASNKVFKKEVDFYILMTKRLAGMRTEIVKAETHKTRRLLHNLISLNGHALQDLYSFINQEKLSNFSQFRSQKDLVKNELVNSADQAAGLFLRALKNAGAVKNELAVFKKLHEASPKLNFGIHSLHKVILNVANYFFQDFADSQIRLSISKTDARVRLDYESVQVALYHLFDNSAKYAAPGFDISVTFDWNNERLEICFEMTSLYLNEDERGKVGDDGFSGSQAHALGKAGEGLGLGLIQDLLRLNGAEFSVLWGSPLSLGSKYAKNKFFFFFPQATVVTPPRNEAVPASLIVPRRRRN